MMQSTRWRSTLLKALYILLFCGLVVTILEGVARLIGLGDPIIYYNAAWGGQRPLPDQKVSRFNGSTVTVDNQGFRTAIPESPGAVRVLFLGNSVTWGGSRVDDAMLFTEVAANIVREHGFPAYAMNAGVNASSLMNQSDIYAHLRDSVDIVVWLFPWGDVYRPYVTVSFLFPPTRKPRFALVEVIDQLIRVYWRPMFRKTAYLPAEEYARRGVPLGYEAFFETVLEEQMQRNLDAIETAVTDALNQGLPVIVGVTPRRQGDRLLPIPTAASDLLSTLEANGANIIDLHRVIGEVAEVKSVYFDQVHFNAEGHQLIGTALGRELSTLPQLASHGPRNGQD